MTKRPRRGCFCHAELHPVTLRVVAGPRNHICPTVESGFRDYARNDGVGEKPPSHFVNARRMTEKASAGDYESHRLMGLSCQLITADRSDQRS